MESTYWIAEAVYKFVNVKNEIQDENRLLVQWGSSRTAVCQSIKEQILKKTKGVFEDSLKVKARPMTRQEESRWLSTGKIPQY